MRFPVPIACASLLLALHCSSGDKNGKDSTTEPDGVECITDDPEPDEVAADIEDAADDPDDVA